MKPVVYLIQIILAILFILTVLVQQKGAGLGSAFGGEVSFYRSKRGAEKLLFYASITLVVLFIMTSIIGLLL